MSPLCKAPAFKRITDEQLLSAGPLIAVLATLALAAPAIRGVMDYTSFWCLSSVIGAGAMFGSRDSGTGQTCCNIPIRCIEGCWSTTRSLSRSTWLKYSSTCLHSPGNAWNRAGAAETPELMAKRLTIAVKTVCSLPLAIATAWTGSARVRRRPSRQPSVCLSRAHQCATCSGVTANQPMLKTVLMMVSASQQ